ncbi:TPA: hypothetical protein ACPZRZ_001805 [Yersinia enterocolitica]|uniref:hypothetical protein n=1 Tax=Yersiniaceae TaxID=1903411 RepID=UPI00093A9AD3|nr:hypothetical protein [Serratia grimesii]ELI7994232.1 hypothetical protein [Yersinia enterocolitica]ELW7359286.1 hypothetical protein [Yersinia enterocolitica]ELX2285239.1 hypothetical protein [Yersinia enterocolitica]EMA2899943.1 hypothetical protein [Yersinia enterocolitica]EMB6584169.1 hypothetical protein [Yersinia enterocolitica]
MSFTPDEASLTTSSLHSNPFAVLGVTVRNDRRTIVEQAEQQSLLHDADECQRARSMLTNPKNRVAAEMAWLPGVSPDRANRLLDNLLVNTMSVRRERNLPSLAHCNLMAAAFDAVSCEYAADYLAEFILEFATQVDECDLEQITEQINDDRVWSGFTSVMSGELIETEFYERKRIYNGVVKDALNRLPSETLLETLAITVRYATAEGHVAAPELINELLDAYDIEIQSVLDKEDANIQRVISTIREQIPDGEESVLPLLNALEKLTKNWDRFTRPIQLGSKARGIDHEKSVQLAWSLRNLSLELYNQHDMLNAATRLTEIEREVFSELPQFIEKVKEDEAALAEFHIERVEEQKKNDEWNESITFSAVVGRVFKDKLSISPSGIDWDGRHYSLEDINALRWGAVRNSVNGVPTGTTYTIGFTNSLSSAYGLNNSGGAVITLKDEKVFNGFQNALWRAVGIRLIINMLKNLDDGEKITIGSFIIDDAGVTLLKHKFFGSTERVRVGWFDVVVSSSNGEFIISSKHDKKTYSSASYINDWNTHIIEMIIRGAFKKGVRNLSDYLKD